MNAKNFQDGQSNERCTPEPWIPWNDDPVRVGFFEQTCDAVLILDATELRVVEGNAAAAAMLRATGLHALRSRSISELFAELQPDGRQTKEVVSGMIEATLKSGSERFEWLVQRCDGTELWMEMVLTRLSPAVGSRVIAFCRDLTEKRRTLQALRDSEAMHRALFESTRQGVMVHDEQSFFSVNPAAVRILRLNRAEQIVGRHPSDLSAPVQPCGRPSDQLAREYIEACLRDGGKRFEWLTRGADGTEFLMDVQLSAVEVGGRKIIQAVIDDISERKAAEEELRRALQRETELGRLRANVVSMVSHEFRTPLGIIQSSAEILENYYDRMHSDERMEHLVSIRKNTSRMVSMMEDVLFIGRMEAGKMQCTLHRIALPSFLNRLIGDVRAATEDRCCFQLELQGVDGEAWGDERLLQPLLTNLLINASKYSAPKQTVVLNASRVGNDCILVIRDRGIGIPEADREWLFEPFHRGGNVGSTPGSGLGLTIVQRCVELHGGELEIQSQVGSGTTVSIQLPLFRNQPQHI